jgi:uncharacterized membrane protein YdfJ with MMPL/SSD domain
VVAALADLALRRPWALLAANLVVLGIAVVLAVGAPDRLAVGSLALSEPAAEQAAGGPPPDLVIATTGPVPVRSGVYRVALRVIASGVRADAHVSSVRRGPISANGRSTSLNVFLSSGDEGERQREVERIEAGIDPGPLRLAFGGEVGAPVEARHSLSGDLWRLEFLVLPFAILVLAAALGPRLAVAPVLCAATAIAGSLAGLRIADAFASVSLLGIAPAAVLGLALGVEAPCLVVARFCDEAPSTPHPVAVRRALAAAAELALPLGVGATAATAGVVATTLDQAGSMVLACGLAAAMALASALVCVPALVVLWGPAAVDAAREPRGEPRLARAPGAVASFLARSRLRTALVGVIAAGAMLAAAAPALHGDSRPFSSFDLPLAAHARTTLAEAASGATPAGAAASATGGGAEVPGDARQSLFEKLALAAGVSAGALAIVLVLSFRSLRVLPVAIVTLLPAAAACGLCVLLFQDGHPAAALGQRRQAALETGAVASMLTGLVAVLAARGVTALRAARGERGLGLAPGRGAETAAAFTVPAAIVATLVVAAATAVLAGADLYPAREFGLAVAAGLLVDLVFLRVPLIAALARWGGED